MHSYCNLKKFCAHRLMISESSLSLRVTARPRLRLPTRIPKPGRDQIANLWMILQRRCDQESDRIRNIT